MMLSIIIPVYNEAGTIEELLKRVKKTKVQKEIIVIDDNSNDGTLRIIKAINGIKVLRHKENKGKGAAVRSGIKVANGDILLIQDADLEYDPNDYLRLIKPIVEGRESVVYGTRLKNYPIIFFGKKHTPFLMHYLGNKFLSFATSVLYRNSVSDMETCYKVFKSDVIKKIDIKSNRFEFEPEVTAKVLKMGYKIHEVPIKVNPRGYDEGKKITWMDGFLALWTLVKYRFVD